MDERVFLYLRLRVGATVLSRSKICEFAALGRHMARFLNETLSSGIELPPGTEDAPPVLEYVDANTERVLIAFRTDLDSRVQVIEGCIPPAKQTRLLDPDQTSFAMGTFVEEAKDGLPLEQRSQLDERFAHSYHDVLARIRESMDDEGHFEVRIPFE